MRPLRLMMCFGLILGLAACFVQHPQPIGEAVSVDKGEWSGSWVAAPNRDGEEPGFFRATDVDPEQGVFDLAEADADGNPTSEPMEMRLRQVGAQRFLDVRDKKGEGPWMLFVVEEASAEKIVLAWKPAAKPFEAAIARGDFKAKLKKTAVGDVEEIAFSDLDSAEADYLAKNWRDLFVAERIVLKRMVVAD